MGTRLVVTETQFLEMLDGVSNDSFDADHRMLRAILPKNLCPVKLQVISPLFDATPLC